MADSFAISNEPSNIIYYSALFPGITQNVEIICNLQDQNFCHFINKRQSVLVLPHYLDHTL